MKEKEPEIEDFSYFLSEFNKESARGAVLSASAFLDERLEDMLKAFLADLESTEELLNGFNAPLGTFSSRIKIAYSLGLIEKNEYDTLNVIRKIRNEFGHKWKDISFSTTKIKDLCNNLIWMGPKEIEDKADSRGRFNFAVAVLLANFLWRSRLIKKEKRNIRNWPNKTEII